MKQFVFHRFLVQETWRRKCVLRRSGPWPGRPTPFRATISTRSFNMHASLRPRRCGRRWSGILRTVVGPIWSTQTPSTVTIPWSNGSCPPILPCTREHGSPGFLWILVPPSRPTRPIPRHPTGILLCGIPLRVPSNDHDRPTVPPAPRNPGRCPAPNPMQDGKPPALFSPSFWEMNPFTPPSLKMNPRPCSVFRMVDASVRNLWLLLFTSLFSPRRCGIDGGF
jgi:hypothetical protein